LAKPRTSAGTPTLLLMTLTIDSTPAQQAALTRYWRLISGFDLPGAFNMALDEALLESVVRGGEPVLRFYTWKPATLSLGVNQSVQEIDRAQCTARGFDVVRRITGGRAVLHQHELTYSVIARNSDPRVSGGVIESYRKISAALVAGLRALGADVSLARPGPEVIEALSKARRVRNADQKGESNGAVCFDVASGYELNSGGRKLVGSAQARRGGALLQHGSILLDIDWDAWTWVFAYASEQGRARAREKLMGRMTSLRQELGRAVSAQEVAGALARSFEHVMDISLQSGEATPDEMDAAKLLAETKYGTSGWTVRL
jgi:lipoate-protein ligase A